MDEERARTLAHTLSERFAEHEVAEYGRVCAEGVCVEVAGSVFYVVEFRCVQEPTGTRTFVVELYRHFHTFTISGHIDGGMTHVDQIHYQHSFA